MSDIREKIIELDWDDKYYSDDFQRGEAIGRYNALLEAADTAEAEVARLEARVRELEKLYYELLSAVGDKNNGETRHQTALRYIKNAEVVKAAFLKSE